MISRLVLVGVVGALGISVPTWPEVREWMGAAHSWTASQLAAWDACSRSEVDSITMVPTPRPLPVGTGRDAGGDLRPSERLATKFEPIVIDERVWDLADALNQKAEGLVIAWGEWIARGRPSEGIEKRSNDARRRDNFSPAFVTEGLDVTLMAALVQAAESPNAPAVPIVAPIAERRCRAPFAPLVCAFTRSSSTPQTPTKDRVKTSVPASDPGAVTLPSLGMRPVSDAMPGTGPELDCFAPPFDPPAAAVAVANTMPGTGPELDCFARPFDLPAPAVPVATGTRPAFDPIDPGTKPGTGMAERLNRASEGLAVDRPAPILNDRDQPQPSSRPGPIAPPAAPVAEVPRPIPAPHVAQALRLTGEAVHAWMNVLTGPAIVQVSAR
jgi:hypothetical protein